MKILILATWLAAAAIALQAQNPPPPADPHAGQPDTCNNDPKNPHPCACNHAQECPPEDRDNPPIAMSPKCQTYCRDEACTCVGGCTDMKGRT